MRDLQLMEPHRATNLTLYTSSSLATRAEWTVTRSSVIGSLRPRVGSDIEISTLSTTFDAGTAPTVEFKCRSPGYRYIIEVALSTGETHSETLACLYKRRELRALRAADRDDLLDAMWQTYSLSKAEGQARYGKEFRDLPELLDLHNFWASDRECDHLHDGVGFSLNHLSITLVYEAVLQFVCQLGRRRALTT